MNILMIFLDGVGIQKNSILHNYDHLRHIISGSDHIDAVMGVDGIPQSGTGQTSIFCGVNAQKIIGRHQYAYPDKKLRKIIENYNIFSELKKNGLKVCFSNAYTKGYFSKVVKRRSVTTWMTYYSETDFLTENDLYENRAVYHDITNKTYRGNIKKIIKPEKAALNLIDVAKKNDFTLFEYFLTDRMGHKREPFFYLDELNDFLGTLLKKSKDIQIILTSDHGNIEDLSKRSHTLNDVPFFTQPYIKNDVKNISDIKHFVLKLLT